MKITKMEVDIKLKKKQAWGSITVKNISGCVPFYSFLKRINIFSIFILWKTQKWFSVYGIVSWVFSQLFFAEWQTLRPTGPRCSSVLPWSQDGHVYHQLLCSCSVMSGSVSLPGSSVHADYLGKNTGVDCYALLLAICRTHVSFTAGRFFTTWSCQGSPRILEWAAYPFSKGSSWPRNWTRSPAFQADSLPTELPGKPH